MPGVSKVVDRAEAIRMLRSGVTLQGMVDFYAEVYGVSTTQAMWSRFRKNFASDGPAPAQRQYDLIPWVSRRRTKGSRLREGLTAIARQMSGKEMTDYTSTLARQLMNRLLMGNTVVDYDPINNRFIEVPRRVGIDQGWVKDPFIDDDGCFIPDHGAFIRSNAYDAYVRTGGLSLQDHDRPLLEGETRRKALD